VPAPVAVTVPVFAYCPACAVPVAVQVMSAPAASWVSGHDGVTPGWLSVTEMPDSVVLPVFVTM
jgi:hypothetical protein